MRKRIVTPVQQPTELSGQNWLNLEQIAEVEITSEDAAHPIESALLPVRASGCRALVGRSTSPHPAAVPPPY